MSEKSALKELAVNFYFELFKAYPEAGGDFITGPFPAV